MRHLIYFITDHFIKDITVDHPITFKGILVSDWICRGLSITLVPASYFLSHLAFREAVKQFDTAAKNSNIRAAIQNIKMSRSKLYLSASV